MACYETPQYYYPIMVNVYVFKNYSLYKIDFQTLKIRKNTAIKIYDLRFLSRILSFCEKWIMKENPKIQSRLLK